MPRRSRPIPPSPPQTPVEQPGWALPHEHWSSQLVHTLPNDYVLTTLGGSSSCYKHGYGEYIRNRSAGNVTWWNPSQGSSGSDWAALYLDSLVPQNTSVVLWEFAINDWWALPAGISEANFQQQVLELFLRRLVHRIPKVTVGIVVLWQPYALKCWPECPRDDIKWNQPVAARTRALQREYCQLCGGRQRYRETAVHQPHTAAGGSAPSNGRRPRDDCRGGAAPPALACCSKAVLAGRSAAVAASSLLPRGD